MARQEYRNKYEEEEDEQYNAETSSGIQKEETLPLQTIPENDFIQDPDYFFSEHSLPVIYALNKRDAYRKIRHYAYSAHVAPNIRKKFNDLFFSGEEEQKVYFQLKGSKGEDGIKEYCRSDIPQKEDKKNEEEPGFVSKTDVSDSGEKNKRMANPKQSHEQFMEHAKDFVDQYAHFYGNEGLVSRIKEDTGAGEVYELMTALLKKDFLTQKNLTDIESATLMMDSMPAPVFSGKVIRMEYNGVVRFIPETLYMEIQNDPEKLMEQYKEEAMVYLRKIWYRLENFLKDLPNESAHEGGKSGYHKTIKSKTVSGSTGIK